MVVFCTFLRQNPLCSSPLPVMGTLKPKTHNSVPFQSLIIEHAENAICFKATLVALNNTQV
jgi:hypothetical protein